MSTDSKLGFVLFVAVLILYSPTLIYIVLAFFLCKGIYSVSFRKGRTVLVLSVALPLAVWLANRVYFEHEKRVFEAAVRSVPTSPKPQDMPSTMVVLYDPGPVFIRECFPNVLVSSADPVADVEASFSYSRWDERSKSGDKPQRPGRYLILRVGGHSRFWRGPYSPADGSPYELSFLEGTSQKLIALEYSFPKQPPFFPPLLTLAGLLPVSDAMNTDEIGRRVIKFVDQHIGCR